MKIDKLKSGQRVRLANGGHAVIRQQIRGMKLVIGDSEFGDQSFIWTYDGAAVSGFSISLRRRIPSFDIVVVC